MPRTVPTIDGTPTLTKLSIRYIDANGGKRSDTAQFDNTSTAAEKEALIVALAAASNANIYTVEDVAVYNSTPQASDALDVSRPSVRENVVLLFKAPLTNNARDYFIPAPIDAMFTIGTNMLNTVNANLLAVRDAIQAMLIGYEPVTVRYTERRKKNPSSSLPS